MPTISRKARRVLLTSTLALAMLVAFASLGGVSIATSAIGAAQYQYGHKITICHKGKTITVARASWKAHAKHGDTVGPCTAAQVRKAKAAAAKAKAAKVKAAKVKAAKVAAAKAKAQKAKPQKPATSTTQTQPGSNGQGQGGGKPADKGGNGKGKGGG